MRLRQVLVNLLSNAIKYNHAGGQVIVEANDRVDLHGVRLVRIAVTDTGPGMTPAQQMHLVRALQPPGRPNAATSKAPASGWRSACGWSN